MYLYLQMNHIVFMEKYKKYRYPLKLLHMEASTLFLTNPKRSFLNFI
jgi:hypothetical protein